MTVAAADEWRRRLGFHPEWRVAFPSSSVLSLASRSPDVAVDDLATPWTTGTPGRSPKLTRCGGPPWCRPCTAMMPRRRLDAAMTSIQRSSFYMGFNLLRFGNTAYLYISVAFIQMLKALMPVATFIMAVLCGTDKLRWDLFLNMVLVSVGVVVSSYGEIHFNVIGTVYQVTGIFAEALRLVLTQVLLQKKGLTLNPITSLYYIAPCSFIFLFVPWYLLEKPEMDVSQIQFNYWIFFLNAVSAFALNISIFLVIGRTGAVTIRVAGVLKDWILIALSTIIFPESIITSLNIIGYAVALSGVIMYNYLKMKDVANQLPVDNIPDRATKDKKIPNIYKPDNSMDSNDETVTGGLVSEAAAVDEEAPLIPSSRLSYVTRTQTGSLNNR